jgi:hypothetical protein
MLTVRRALVNMAFGQTVRRVSISWGDALSFIHKLFL